ncbi:MAG: hypothetical protein AAF462_10230 [Thermodesulfobacteriota bacterium]
MAISVLMVYQPIESTKDKESYWRSYVDFYEKFWDGPATPQSSWFGRDYEEFRKSLSNHLGLNIKDLQDCFFLKDEDGKYYIVPVGSKVNINLFSAENFIPFEWFLMFSKDEKNYFYTHTGFGAIQHDAIYYKGEVNEALKRLTESKANIEIAINSLDPADSQYLSDALKELGENIENLENWISGFDPKSFIILNYGEICAHIEPNSMKNEDSVTEIHNVLTLAAQGKLDEAQSAFTYLASKWNEIRGAITGDRPESTSTVQ